MSETIIIPEKPSAEPAPERKQVKRVQLDMSLKMFDLISELESRIDASSRAEVLRRATSVFAVLLDALDEGKRIEIFDPKTGQRERLVVP